jgi:dephospho-CoA kinase
MLKIVITGGIACGKSLVGSFFSEAGFAVCDTDDLAHSLLMSGSYVFNEVIRVFGKDILLDDGEIDRQRLGTIVFSNPEKLAMLNTIIHPRVKRMWIDWLAQKFEIGCKVAVLIVPLLFEIGEDKGWDAVICVSASDEVQVRRLKERGLSDSEIKRRIAAQWPITEKMKLADYVIRNDWTEGLLKQQVEIVIKHVREKEKRQ